MCFLKQNKNSNVYLIDFKNNIHNSFKLTFNILDYMTFCDKNNKNINV